MIDMSSLYSNVNYRQYLVEFNLSSRPKRWSIFKPVQLEVAKYKCPFCECSLANGELLRRPSTNSTVDIISTIDHYRPKDHSLYPFLKYYERNYILMCSDCNNAYKNNLFPLYGSTPRGSCILGVLHEKPLIVNPIYDNLLDLFSLTFKYTQSGKKVLELVAKSSDLYLKAKAEETIRIFSLGNCEVNIHNNGNVQQCRISLLSDHFKRFHGFVEAIEGFYSATSDFDKDRYSKKAAYEIKKYNLRDYGFYKFIQKKQYVNLV